MSFEAMAMVVKVENISPVNKLILLLLANYADDKRQCFPSYEKIAKLANCSRRTAVRSINTLSELGLISIYKRKLSNNDNQSNIYTVNEIKTAPHKDIVPSVKLTPPPSDTMSPPSAKHNTYPSDTMSPPSDTMSPNTITLNNQLNTITIDRFSEFWNVWPQGHKSNKKGCLDKWKSKNLNSIADEIITDVVSRSKESKKWTTGYIPAPLTYINQERWHDDLDKVIVKVDTESFEYMNMIALGVIDEKKSEVA